MTLNIEREVAVMRRMTVGELRGKFAEVFGEGTNARNKDWLVKRIAWRMQANEEGDLSERARRRAMELANDAELRVMAPRKSKVSPDVDHRTATLATRIRPDNAMLPGMMLKREYKGQTIHVKVLVDGFEYEGERYRSLTAVAKAVTGTHWNGLHFFGLRPAGGGK